MTALRKAGTDPAINLAAAFRDNVPYVSDENGVFDARAARMYLEKHLGAVPGTANATVFYWSDPTERLGFRRFRRTKRRNSGDPSEGVVRNPLAGTKSVLGWPPIKAKVDPSPVASAVSPRTGLSRRKRHEVDALFFETVAAIMDKRGGFQRSLFFAVLPESEWAAMNGAFHKRAAKWATQNGSGYYILTQEGIERMSTFCQVRSDLIQEKSKNPEQQPGGVEPWDGRVQAAPRPVPTDWAGVGIANRAEKSARDAVALSACAFMVSALTFIWMLVAANAA